MKKGTVKAREARLTFGSQLWLFALPVAGGSRNSKSHMPSVASPTLTSLSSLTLYIPTRYETLTWRLEIRVVSKPVFLPCFFPVTITNNSIV